MTFELFALLVIAAIGLGGIVSLLLWATLPMKRDSLMDNYERSERGE